MRLNMLSRLSLLLSVGMMLTSPVLAGAEETIDSVLNRMQFKESQYFHYQETRQLALLNRPWIATGDMFIIPEGMVMAQRSPASILTQITANKLEYFDAERDVRRSMHLQQPFAVPGMAPFLQILYRGRQHSGLEEQYKTDFSLKQDRWVLVLTPKQADKSKIKAMTLAGSKGKGPDRMKLEYTDGDQTEWSLSLVSHGHEVARVLQKTLDTITEENDFDD